MSLGNPLIRLLIGIVAIAAALRITWLLVEPLLPVLAVALVAFALIRVALWYRDRW